MARQDTISATPLFADAEQYGLLPTPIANHIALMMYELEHSGEETTADETATAIEATFTHLGRLWTAEYLHAADSNPDMVDETINRILLERAASGRPTLTGQWVGLSRQIRDLFVQNNVPTVLKDLAVVDFGSWGDSAHPVARLLNFRNHFSHGSFQSTVDGIRTHRQLLHDLLASLPCLIVQPALVRETETGVVRRADQNWTVVDTPNDVEIPDVHPMILGVDGAVLDLYPMMHLSYDGPTPVLASPGQAHPARNMFERSAFSVWLERYERDRNGYLPYDGPADASNIALSLIEGTDDDGLRAALSGEHPGLILVEGFPGCGTEGAIAALSNEDPCDLGLDRYAAMGRVSVRPGDLGQSGLTVARIVLRLIEAALGEETGSRSSSLANILNSDGPLSLACADLAQSGKRVLLGVESLHRGIEAYRGESFTVVDVYQALADTAVDVIATVVPGGIERPLFDHKIDVPVPDEPNADEVATWVHQLCERHPLRGRILNALVSAGQTMDLFSLCDALETAGPPVFEPAVERALWDLRPVLSWHRVEIESEGGKPERVRHWGPFSTVISAEMLGGAS